MIKIIPRFCFSPPLYGLRLSFLLLRCWHVGHTFPLTSKASSVGTKMNSDPGHRLDSDIMLTRGLSPYVTASCVDTSEKGRLITDLCPRTKVSRLPFPTPCVIPGLQNKTETNKSNFRLDLSCLGLSTHTESLSSSIWIQH